MIVVGASAGGVEALICFVGSLPGRPQDLGLPTLNRRGRTLDVRVTATPLRGDDAAVTGAVVVVEEARPPQPSA